MKIILLSGAPNCGKTTTLNLVYDQMTSGMPSLPTKTRIGENPMDFECEFDYKEKRVAIFTVGDYLYSITKPNLREAVIKYSRVDVLILAHSTGGSTKNAFAATVGNKS
jgi:broad-specificity NMP kinase